MNLVKFILYPFYALLEWHRGYEFVRKIGDPTVRIFRIILHQFLGQDGLEKGSVLDIACGSGGNRDLFPENYYGIDINPDYIRAAAARYKGSFEVMDCQHLIFEDNKFDAVVTVASTHHLDDRSLQTTISEALRVVRSGGRVHIIDAVLPFNPLHIWKEIWFRCDRGKHPRRAKKLLKVINQISEPVIVEFFEGRLHDVIYICLSKDSQT